MKELGHYNTKEEAIAHLYGLVNLYIKETTPFYEALSEDKEMTWLQDVHIPDAVSNHIYELIESVEKSAKDEEGCIIECGYTRTGYRFEDDCYVPVLDFIDAFSCY